MNEWVSAALAPLGEGGDGAIASPEALSAEVAARLKARILDDRRRSWAGMLGKTAIYPHPSGLSFWVLLGDSMSAGIIRADRDDVATRFLLGRLTPGGTFLDIGANAGWFAIRAAARYREIGGGTVHAFEPQALLHGLVERTAALNALEGVHVHQLALGDRTCDVFMADGGMNSGGSYVRFRGSPGRAATPMRPLDALDLPIERVDAVKIDIEGAEPMFFRGAAGFVARHRPFIYSELHPRKLDRVSGSSRAAYLDQVEAAGYETLALARDGTAAPFDRGLLAEEGRLHNVLFRPRERSLA